MRRIQNQLALIALVAVAVVSCDTRLPTASRRAAPGTPPSVVIDSPVVNSQINVGDSIFVRVLAVGGNALRSLIIRADAVTGDKDLGTYAETPRYTAVTVNLPVGTTDTVIRRYLKPIDDKNQSLESLVIIAVLDDSLGLRDTARVRATLVSGPSVRIEAPAPNDSVPPGVAVSINAHATDLDGINRVEVRVQGDASWPTRLDTTVFQVYPGTSRDVTFNAIVQIPPNAPARSRVTVNASAIDGNRQPGSASPISLFIRSSASVAAPHVTQVVPPRSERTDTIQITASGQGIAAIGIVVRDSAGGLVDRDSILLPAPLTSNVKKGIPLRLPIAQQGRRVAITAFAVDQTGRTGYAVRTSTSPVETILANAQADSTQITHGQTFQLPLPGTVGDIAVDVGRGNVFLSNTIHNRLEVWQSASRAFGANGVAVGSLPWGLFVSNNPDTLLVANSGGTNISRVFIGSSSLPALREDLPNRILTRNVFVHTVLELRDAGTGKVTISKQPIISYSDRPQYLAQASTGRIYFSTRPTSFAPEGTIRYLDPSPSLPAPDPRIVWQYIEGQAGTDFRWTIFNIDSVGLFTSGPNSAASDRIVLFDHEYGKTNGITYCVNAPPTCPSVLDINGNPDPTVQGALQAMRLQGSDIEYGLRLDMTKLPLTDTTFVAASVSRNWIAFGEGNSAPGSTGARIMMVADSQPFRTRPQFISEVITVRDLTENASERVFGIALDKSGKTVSSHGLQSYFSSVDAPFHLRLQGFYDSNDIGAGITFHPDADGKDTPAAVRLGFVASSTGEIEIVDIAYFINRGRLQLKYPIYGPLRATKPMPGDDPSVILKLFALTVRGLIVIDVTAPDIKAGPP